MTVRRERWLPMAGRYGKVGFPSGRGAPSALRRWAETPSDQHGSFTRQGEKNPIGAFPPVGFTHLPRGGK